MSLQVLLTKLHVPSPRPDAIPRPRLTSRLSAGLHRKLSLISAPAGFGKSSLLSAWLAMSPACERQVAWVALDPVDDDPRRFWTYVIAGLRTVRPEIGASALSLLESAQPTPVEAILTTLINEIATIEDDIILILDDFHAVESLAVHHGVAFLLDHLPPRLHLVIATREDPQLPLARLRARGELSELRAADLRFTPDEAAAFLNEAMGLNLSAPDVAALETRTEGWIAGLQLAALSLRGRNDAAGFIRAFAGDDRYIVDYLVEEVLQRQPDRVRSFLLQTSVLDRLSGPLCDAVTGRDDGKELLETLERGNLFVVPLDDKRQWYRYHHLFADVLRAYLLDAHPDQVPDLHRRAAAWFEERGMAAEAIDQARAAGDHDAVARLLVANWEEFERLGRSASISRWSASLPGEMLRARPRLALIFAASSLASDNTNQAARRLTAWAEDAINALEDRGEFDPAADVDGTVVGPEGLDALKGELLAMKILHSFRRMSPEELAATAGEALRLLPQSLHRVRTMLRMMDAAVHMELGGMESALPGLEDAVAEARRARHPTLLAGALAHRGQVYANMGRLEDARLSFEEALLAGQEASIEASHELCSPHTGLAEVLLERGDLAASVVHAEQALEFAAKAPTRSPVLYATTTAAQVMVAAGDIGAALAHLAEARAFVRGSSDSRYASFLSSVELRLGCWIGNLETAGAIVRERRLSPDVAIDADNEEEMTAYARFLVARGEGHSAARVLSRVLPVVRRRGRVLHEIHALTLQAQAYEVSGERALALESLGRATVLGEPGRFTRTFTAEGPGMATLLEALADDVQRSRGPAACGSSSYLAYLLRETHAGSTPSAATAATAELPERLTGREVEILRLVAAGLRNQEIADHLFISLPTVKRHLANAYGKLGVGHRTEAIARAHELHLM